MGYFGSEVLRKSFEAVFCIVYTILTQASYLGAQLHSEAFGKVTVLVRKYS